MVVVVVVVVLVVVVVVVLVVMMAVLLATLATVVGGISVKLLLSVVSLSTSTSPRLKLRQFHPPASKYNVGL